MTAVDMEESHMLVKALLLLRDEDEVRRFLEDLLTEQEITEFSKRWKAARMLSQKLSYVQIENETGLSSTTIARVSKWLQSGKGGYRLVLNRLHEIETGQRADPDPK